MNRLLRSKHHITSLATLALLSLANLPALASPLPADIQAAISKDYVADGMETRYLDASTDLNGDGKPEIIVHLLGSMACGSGGCTTLIFSPSGSTYQQIGKISVSRLPIRIAAESNNGWRDLVVHVAGGGQTSGERALSFNGQNYPSNPSVIGNHVKATDAKTASILIQDINTFDEAHALPNTVVPAVAGTSPSFDCNKAGSSIEKPICSDAKLGALDQQLAETYNRAMSPKSPWSADEKAAEHKQQQAWLGKRNACAARADVKSCVVDLYQRRLTVLQIKVGELMAPTTTAYLCKEQLDLPIYAAFYNQTQPQSVVLTRGKQQTIAFIARSGSGARYTNDIAEFWEHQGEATISWNKQTYHCKVSPNKTH